MAERDVEPHRLGEAGEADGAHRVSDVSHALLIDLYELTMVDAYRRAGMAARPATFSLFVRTLPPERRVLIAAGLDDCLTWLENLRFADEDLAHLDRLAVFEPSFLDWLATIGFTGDVRAMPEGTPVYGEEPILEVDGPIAEAQLAESFLLNQITLQTTLATKAARMKHAADGAGVVDFALRRTPGIDAAMKLARVARIVGLEATSNIAGSVRYGTAPSGTMAHSFVQAHADETDAFRAFADAYRDRAILLVDTYDTPRGVERAITVAGECRVDGFLPRGIRIDSGDLDALTRLARDRLDAADLAEMGIYVSGGLDEHDVAALVASGAPIDGFGVGSSLGAPTDAPTLDSVYKLVTYDGLPVRKTSPGKTTWPCAKQVWRSRNDRPDVLATADEARPHPGASPLLEPVMSRGSRTEGGRRTLDDAHDHFVEQWEHLPDDRKQLDGQGSNPVVASDGLTAAVRHLDEGATR